jgi:23S rRNA pseudouridine2604 synthase
VDRARLGAVNGQVAAMGVPVTDDRVEVLPAAQRRQESQVTILLHKPVGYVSGQPEDGHESAAVLHQAKNQWRSDPPPARAGLAAAARAAWRRPGGWTSTPPGCWC